VISAEDFIVDIGGEGYKFIIVNLWTYNPPTFLLGWKKKDRPKKIEN